MFMAIKKIRMRPEGTNDYGDVLYPETSADVVVGLADAIQSATGDKVLQTIFDEHLAEKATLTIDAHVRHGTFTTTLNTTWTGTVAPFSKVQTVTGMLATDNPIIDLVLSGTYATDIAMLEAWGCVYRIVTSDNTVTLYATAKPLVSLPIQLKVVR